MDRCLIYLFLSFRCIDTKITAHVEDVQAIIAVPMDRSAVVKTNPKTYGKIKFAEITEVLIRPHFILKKLEHDGWKDFFQPIQCDHEYNRPIQEVDFLRFPIWEMFCSGIGRLTKIACSKYCQPFKNWLTKNYLEEELKKKLNKKLKGKTIMQVIRKKDATPDEAPEC